MKIELKQPLGNQSRVIATISGRAKGGGTSWISESAHRIIIGLGTSAYRAALQAQADDFSNAPISDISSWSNEAPGSLIVVDKTDHAVYVSIDLLGCFPFFYRSAPDAIWLSDQASELCNGSESFDPAGMTELLRFGFCVGDATPFLEVRRIRPGEHARFKLGSDVVTREDRSALWTNCDQPQAATALDKFCEDLKGAARSDDPVRLMMSGGWDSRLLLAACLAANATAKPELYFHGDVHSREAGLVRRIQAIEGLQASYVEITPAMFNPDTLAHHFGHFESVSFPFWHAARDDNPQAVTNVMAGIFGEVVGGHYGPPMAVSGQRRKIIESLAWLLMPARTSRRITATNGLARAREVYRQRPYPAAWYMKRDVWQDQFSTVHLEVEDRILAALDRYRSRGIRAAHSLIEAFITEHRGSQFIAAQLHSSSAPGAFCAPFANRSIIELAAAIPFQSKAFNRFSQSAIARLWPSLLQLPLAATLAKAARPVTVLEGTRALRKMGEAALRSSPVDRFLGTSRRPHLSWVNFESIAKSGVLNDVVESLHLPLWSKPQLHDAIARTTANDAHPLTDMLMKIKTLDLLSGGRDLSWPRAFASTATTSAPPKRESN